MNLIVGRSHPMAIVDPASGASNCNALILVQQYCTLYSTVQCADAQRLCHKLCGTATLESIQGQPSPIGTPAGLSPLGVAFAHGVALATARQVLPHSGRAGSQKSISPSKSRSPPCERTLCFSCLPYCTTIQYSTCSTEQYSTVHSITIKNGSPQFTGGPDATKAIIKAVIVYDSVPAKCCFTNRTQRWYAPTAILGLHRPEYWPVLDGF